MTHFASSMRLHLTVVLATAVVTLAAQTNSYWNTNGNAAGSSNFLGTTNNEALIFKTNGIEAMRIKSNGDIKIAAFENMGKGVLTVNNNGVMNMKAFPNDTNQVFCGSGNFKSVAALSGWTRTGNVLYNATGVNVGIGTSNPQYALDVVGSAYFTGTVSAQGVILTNKLMADTMKAGNMFSLNNKLHMSAGTINEIYTSNGDLRFQSNVANNHNVIFSAGTTGYVGIGTFSPQYKLDVNGNANVAGRLYTYRILSNAGDSIIRIGDSTIYINYNWGNIANMNTNLNSPFKGMGIGELAIGAALHSNAMGYRVRAQATNSIALGARSSGTFVNNIANSLMVGFESNLATLFVGPANGQGTVGKVGVGTSTPQSDFQVGNASHKLSVGEAGGTNWFGTSYVGFNLSKSAPNQWIASSDGFNNGGIMLQGNVQGAFRIVQIRYSQNPAQDQTLTDQDMEDNVVFRISDEGRVEIGKEYIVGGPHGNSFTKLTVDGKIVCKELFVTKNNWADSVFYDSYTLMPMDSLRAFIDSTGHLPNVPTESDIKVNGSNLAQNDVILLAKVEELTLYMLQLQEQNMKLQKRIEELEADKEEQPK